MAPASWYMAARDPIGIALAASSLAIPAGGAFVATENVAAGVVLIVLAWVALLACCLDLLQAMWKAGARRDRRKLTRIAACPAPLERARATGHHSSSPFGRNVSLDLHDRA